MTAINDSNMREARAEPLMLTAPTNQPRLHLRWNWQMNCWQVWNYLSSPNKPWKYFCISIAEARSYAAHRVPVVIEETVA